METAAIVHDIGIKAGEEKYGDCNGTHREELGPAIAVEMHQMLGHSKEVIDRARYLVVNYHNYQNIDGIDYQILVESNSPVNPFWGSNWGNSTKQAYERIFGTNLGKIFEKQVSY